MSVQTKAAVTVAEMSRMVGLSRARFYQLVEAGVFPRPVYDVHTRRPIYFEEMQQVCLEVRRRNCGINGRAVLFYCKGGGHSLGNQKKRKEKKVKNKRTELLDGLAALGLVGVTVEDVDSALRFLFSDGTPESDPGDVLKKVFLHLKRRDS